MAVQRGLFTHVARASTSGAMHMRFCTGTVGMPREKCSTSSTSRFAGESLIERPRMSFCRPVRASDDPGNEAFGLPHVAAVFVAEVLQHHLLFASDAERIQDRRSGKPRAAPDPVRQQQELRKSEQKERRIHRMPHETVDARLYQPVIAAHFEADRPISPEFGMAAQED